MDKNSYEQLKKDTNNLFEKLKKILFWTQNPYNCYIHFLQFLLYIYAQKFSLQTQMNKKQQCYRIRPTPSQRKVLIFCFYVSNFTAIPFYCLLLHFIIWPIPFIKQWFPSLLSDQNNSSHYFYNAFVYSLFYVQHILMAFFSFKQKLVQINRNYVLFERFIYNFTSLGVLILTFYMVYPASPEISTVFTLPYYITFPLLGIGIYLYVESIKLLGGDLASQYKLEQIKTAEYLERPYYSSRSKQKILDNGIYGICRHPMQLAFILIFMFGSGVYTVDRLIFIGVHLIGIIVGVYYEEKRLLAKFGGYTQYKQKVKHGLIPYVF